MSDKVEQPTKQYNDLLFSIRRSVRYHNRRRSFFDRFHKTTTTLSVIGGSAVIATILGPDGNALPLAFAAIVAIAGAFDLVVNCAEMARFHHDMARKYFEIEKDMILHQNQADNSLITAWTTRRLDIEAEEPPVLHVLNAICHNELCRAMGYGKDSMVKIGRFQRIFSSFIDFNEDKIKVNSTCRQ